MAFGTKTNERPGTRASVRHVRVSAYKAREVLDLIRGLHVDDADGVLEFTDRAVAVDVRKLLASAVANAEHNDEIDPSGLYVSACFADEGPTLKRWRPRARGRATRIRKRTCHITIIVSRLSEEQLERRRRAEAASPSGAGRGRRRAQAVTESRRQRVAKSRQREQAAEEHDHEGHEHDEVITDDVENDAVEADAVTAEEIESEAPEVEAEADTTDEATDAEEEEK
jgi:large subunit ribosomal protein L22